MTSTSSATGARRKRPTLAMVAELAGVSTATVSYVFSGRGGEAESRVSPELTERVLAAAQELHYRPNRAARTIRTGRSETVQLSLYMLSDPWSLAVVSAVNAEANKHGLTTLILADGDWHTALDRVECDVAFLDGVPDTPDGRRKLADLVARGQRLVVFSETLQPDGFDVIRSLALPGCALAMEHLLEHHTRIGAIAATWAVAKADTHETRFSVYLQALRERGIQPRAEWTQTHDDTQAGAFNAAIRLLSQDDRPSAVYATTDFAAIATINAAHALGLRVPADVAVIGIGSTPDAQVVSPTLTTVGPADFFARQAKIIVDRAVDQSPAPPEVHEFAWALVPGGSTISV